MAAQKGICLSVCHVRVLIGLPFQPPGPGHHRVVRGETENASLCRAFVISFALVGCQHNTRVIFNLEPCFLFTRLHDSHAIKTKPIYFCARSTRKKDNRHRGLKKVESIYVLMLII